MAKHMRAHDLADAGGGRRAQQGSPGGIRTEWTARLAGEQPGFGRLLMLVVGPQQSVEFGVHGHHPLLATLAVADVDHLQHGVNVPGLQEAGLVDPQAGGVDQGEKHPVLGGCKPVQEPLDLRPGQDRGQVRFGLGDGDPGHLLRLAQSPGK